MLPKWAWSGSREQFLHCGLRKFRHSKSSVYRWYIQLDRRRFVYDTWDNGRRLGRIMVECTLSITHCLRLNLQLHTINLVRTCRISSFCTVAWQLASFNWHDASRGPLAIAELLVLQAGCPSCRPTNSVKALKAQYKNRQNTKKKSQSTLMHYISQFLATEWGQFFA